MQSERDKPAIIHILDKDRQSGDYGAATRYSLCGITLSKKNYSIFGRPATCGGCKQIAKRRRDWKEACRCH